MAAIVIGSPAANSVKSSSYQNLEVNGSCVAGQILKVSAVDSANKSSAVVWTQCQSWGFAVSLNISALKDGALKVNVLQDAKTNPESASVSIAKGAGTVTPPVVVVPPVVVPPTSSSIVISSPAANSVKGAGALEVNGSCKVGDILKINATDSANKATALVWTQCQSWGYSVQIDISSLKDGAIKIVVLQNATTNAQSQSVSITKTSGTTTTPPVVVVPPVVTPPTTPTNPTTPSTGGIPIGVNGHDGMYGLPVYALSSSEARFKVMQAGGFKGYRAGGDFFQDLASMDKFVALARQYGITLTPNIYHTMTQQQAYTIAKRYANDIKMWEIGNELDGDVGNEQANYRLMLNVYKGIKQAAAETGVDIKTMVNVMACNNDAPGRCYGKADGSMYFLDGAKAAGINFDFISFHYYPHYGDFTSQGGYWVNKYLGQMRAMATKYNTKIYYNEMNCGEIYDGVIDGQAGDKSCYDSINAMLTLLNKSYSDIVAQVQLYELIENPDHPVTHERHFGLMYNTSQPKNIFNLVTDFAKGIRK
jgi:Arabinogalactan endo-1,4-beta-galactosidase